MALNKRGKPLTNTELSAIVKDRVSSAVNYMADTFTRHRIEAERLYNGDPNVLPWRKNHSSVIDRVVAEAIDTQLAGLMEIFASTKTPVRFLPRNGEPLDQQIADLETEAASYIWYTLNSGFIIFHDWFKAAMRDRLGAIKIYWDESISVKEEHYENLTELQYQALISDPDVTVLEETHYPDPDAVALAENQRKYIVAQSVKNQVYANQNPTPPDLPPLDTTKLPQLSSCTVKRQATKGQVKVILIPPEELLFDQYKTSIDDRSMIGHRRRMTASELRELGYDDKIINKITFADPQQQPLWEVAERFRPESSWPFKTSLPDDPSSLTAWVDELFLYVDYDGDGTAEYRRILAAGDGDYVILENEIVDDHPFAVLTPLPTPFKMVGQSVTDLTKDLQLVKSQLLRGALDNIYKTNNQRLVINKNVNINDLVNSGPGSPIRTDGIPGQDVMPLPVDTGVAQNALEMIQYVDTVRENRTGITRHGAGLDPNILKSHQSAGAVSAVMDASGQRMELMARIFAETGVARAFRRIIDLLIKHQTNRLFLRVAGQPIEIAPTDWHNNFDTIPTVGLGTDDDDKQLATAMQIFPVAAQIRAMPGGDRIISDANVYQAFRWLVKAAGQDPAPFVTDPSTLPPPQPQPPQPDPAVMVASQTEMAKAKMDIQERARQFDAKHALEVQKHVDDHNIALRNVEVAALKIHATNVAADADHELSALELQHKQEQAQQASEVAALQMHQAAEQQDVDRAHQQQMAQQQQQAQQAQQAQQNQPPQQGAE